MLIIFATIALISLSACTKPNQDKTSETASIQSAQSKTSEPPKLEQEDDLSVVNAQTITFEHGEVPTKEELEKHQWYSPNSMNFVSFDNGKMASFKWIKNDDGTYHKLEISNFPYDISDNTMNWEVVINGQNYQGVDDAFIMSWQGNHLKLTPRDDLPEKEKRSQNFIPVKYDAPKTSERD